MNTWNTFKGWCSRHCKKKKVLPYLLNEPAAESVDQAVLDNDPILCMEEDEPEAWSISVEKKVVKKLSSKEVKRQDHIYAAAESVDQAVLDNDPLLCMEEDEPEAWSISVEKKVVKKLSSKEVKRQDHIYAAAESVDQAVLDNDPLLCMEEDEPEAWSISVEKKVVKKLSSKEVKRQDHIYEIIQTEKNYCRILKIMQKILYEGLLRDVGVSKEVLNCLFPCLDELLHFHLAFLSNLQQLQSQNKDKIVDEIGKTLIEQFDGDSSERIKKAYGHFCSHYKEAVNQYKDLKTERKFLSFVERCASNSIFKKREIPDFLLIVTQRLTKYPTLIETIHKNTKDKKERDKLNLALQLAKDMLTNVNSQVEEYECQQRLDDIIHRTDTRSSALYRGRKFKKSDMCSNHRKLIHDGVIGLKTASGEVIDVMAVVLTDLIVLMQENNQKYTFAMRDNKSCVIPLCELQVLVREKGDTKDGKGIYLITRRVTEPEMYELVCKSTKDMWSWINHLLSAVDHCPQDAAAESVDQAVLDNDSLLCMEEDEPEAWSISVEKKVVKKLSSKEVKRQDHIYAAAESVDQAVLDNDPLLCMEEDEPEAWSISVEKKVVKKLSSKEVKRQDHIYEIIQTEKNYCRILKIMQKILYEGLLRDVGVSKEVLNCLFPCLDELLHFHLAFLSNLQQLQSQNKDKIVDEIGKTLIEQFDGDSSERIKKAYGHFCSHYKEAVNQYKDLKTERKFLSFVKRCASNSIFKKREIPDFLLIVTQRLTKYPTLIETIHKNTKDKKERDKLNLALQLAKDILTNVNSQVEEYECQQRLDDIIHRTKTRSSALYRGRKFKKSDMCSNHRKLIHDGVIGLKTASGKVIDVMAVVLTDLIVLMQENNQKYTFAMRDNKSCVIPLCELLVLVREKGDTKDGKGIYLITRRVTEPEMYELVCKSTKDMWSWINHLLSAVDHCPQDAPVEATQSFEKIEEQKMMEIRTRKMKQIFESMTSRDNEIVRLCDEKKSLLLEYTELMSLDDAAPTIVSSTPTLSTLSSSATKATAMEKSPLKEEGLETRDLVQSALEEITRLTKVLQETGASLTPPQGGGTEHLGSSYSTHAVPKRAETFAGFDSKLRKDPSQKRPHSYVNHDGRSSSMFNIYESEGSHKEALKINNRKSTGYLQNMIAKNPALDPDGKQSVNLAGMALLQCVEMIPNPTSPTAPSNTETTAASVVSTPHPPTSCIVDQINNTAHISNFLHNFVQLSVQQSTSIEGMRLQLLEAREKITKLTAEKSEINKHSQLEGLRNLKNDLKLQKEDLQRQWIALQKQYDLLIEHRSDGCARRSLSERSQNPDLPGSDSDNYHNTIQHKRSASAELSSQTPDDVTSSSVQCHH